MAMPETSMDKDHRFPSWKYDVGLAGQPVQIAAESEAAAMKG